MILNCVLAVILRYFTEFGSFGGQLSQSGWRNKTHTAKEMQPKESKFSEPYDLWWFSNSWAIVL